MRSSAVRVVMLIAIMVVAGACRRGKEAPVQAWALAIHGGAGTISRAKIDAATRDAHLASLERALGRGRELLASGGRSVDAVEAVVRMLEDDPLFNAGKGSVLTYDGKHELDASIMDGSALACGAVAGVKTVKNPIGLARAVMEKTRHVLLAGEGAEQLAGELGVERVENSWFTTERRKQQWREHIEKAKTGGGDAGPPGKGTVGAVALDMKGHLAAATSTGGMTGKRWGRIGDSPIAGAGTYADDRSAAVSCTGTGEEFIRHAIAHSVAARVSLLDEGIDVAARMVLAKLRPDDGGFIAIDRTGAIAMVFNTEGMYRGAADASGRFEVAIWH